MKKAPVKSSQQNSEECRAQRVRQHLPRTPSRIHLLPLIYPPVIMSFLKAYIYQMIMESFVKLFPLIGNLQIYYVFS